jgi:hypothetical protein
MMQPGSGVVTASVLAMLLAGVIGGGIVGLVLGGALANQLALALLCALIGAILALVIGYAILGRDAQFSLPPGVVLWNVIVSSLLGGLAGHELSVDLRNPPVSPLVGALSSLLAAVLVASFVITIYVLRDRLSLPKR